ncbi:MAG: hypothetical protein R6V46_14785 [Desulfatiglandaceae bacterium]
MDNLFQETKKAYSADKIFEDEERINLKPTTGEEIVRKLKKFHTMSIESQGLSYYAFYEHESYPPSLRFGYQ